jgi:hypothetical protein
VAEPNRVVVAGDWHGNLNWAMSQLRVMRDLVPDEDPLVVIHCGDFGWWPNSSFPDHIADLAANLNVRIWVTPGNHEEYPVMHTPRWLSDDPVNDSRSLIALKRGTRWFWCGRTWLSVGGAVSADQTQRLLGRSWWPEEELTDAEVEKIISAGIASVLVTHDVGTVASLDLGPWPMGWGEVVRRRCVNHRKRMDWLASGVQPRYWLHGHYHQFYQQTVKMLHGDVKVTGLSLDGCKMNWGVLNVESMRFEIFSPVK